MSAVSRFLAPPLVLVMLAGGAVAQTPEAETVDIDRLKATIAAQHPSAYYMLASGLFSRGDKDEAVFWFYAGQLRYRTHLVCNPDLPPSGDPALFGALSEVIGSEINAYAFGDLDVLLATLDAVLAWDAGTENTFAAGRDCAAAHGEIVSGLAEFRAHIVDNVDLIRSERLANGLENR